MNRRDAVDVSGLPDHAFGARSVMWWATLLLVLIEGTVFAILIASYLFLRGRAPSWPPAIEPPDLPAGTINTWLLLLSCLPNHWAKSAAERKELGPARVWVVVSFAFAILAMLVRVFEFRALHCRWDTNAYGSVLWTLLGLHTTHLVTDAYDTAVLAILLFVKPVRGRRFVDVSENAFYWYFVVFSWIPIYAAIYGLPRWP